MGLEYSHKPRKRFGQNFLQDLSIIEKIITFIHPHPNDRLIEIGPGLGALTKPLLEICNHLDVIEIDRDLARELTENLGIKYAEKLTVHTQDALNFDLNTLVKADSSQKHFAKFRVLGNLPYNISTPLIFHLLEFAPLIQDMHFMLQKEVVDRLIATPNHKTYGKLSIMTQYFCKPEALFEVPPSAFFPNPKVYSAFIRLTPHPTLPHPASNLSLLQKITQTAFNQRRKVISNALKPFLTMEDFETLGVNPKSRPETLSLAEFVRISNYVDHRKENH